MSAITRRLEEMQRRQNAALVRAEYAQNGQDTYNEEDIDIDHNTRNTYAGMSEQWLQDEVARKIAIAERRRNGR